MYGTCVQVHCVYMCTYMYKVVYILEASHSCSRKLRQAYRTNRVDEQLLPVSKIKMMYFFVKILENNICLQTQILNKLARCVNKHRRIVLYVHVMCTWYPLVYVDPSLIFQLSAISHWILYMCTNIFFSMVSLFPFSFAPPLYRCTWWHVPRGLFRHYIKIVCPATCRIFDCLPTHR